MSKLEEREAKAVKARKKSFVQSIVEESRPEVKTERLTQRSYYLTDALIEAVAVKAAKSKVDKSTVVRDALTTYLVDYLEDAKNEE